MTDWAKVDTASQLDSASSMNPTSVSGSRGPPKRWWSTSLSSVNRGQRKMTCSTSSTATGHTGHWSPVSLFVRHRYDLKQP
uniref:Uncharacterized protein n=1 Tax=Trichogramma kaykai TaxID=54128 RepID=A0ABD2WAA0_9HYME